MQWHEAGFAGDHTLDAQPFTAAITGTTRSRCTTCAPGLRPHMLSIRDPLGRIPGVNEYAYCLGEPVDSYDPMGLEGDGLDDIRDQLTIVPGDSDANIGAAPPRSRCSRTRPDALIESSTHWVVLSSR